MNDASCPIVLCAATENKFVDFKTIESVVVNVRYVITMSFKRLIRLGLG